MNVYVAAIAKLENRYVAEWVRHYLNFGFDRVIIVDNNDLDGETVSSAIRPYIESKRVLLENRRGQLFNQKEIYKDVYRKYGKECDWIMFVDIDEFIRSDRYFDIKQFLSQEKFNNFKYIRICWKTFTDSGIIKINGNYSITRFTIPFQDQFSLMSRRCKSIYRTKDLEILNNLSVHTSHLKASLSCNALGFADSGATSSILRPIWTEMWIDHYSTKTIEEYIRYKIKKHVKGNRIGDSCYNTTYIDDLNNFKSFWEINQKTAEKVDFAKKLIKRLYERDYISN